MWVHGPPPCLSSAHSPLILHFSTLLQCALLLVERNTYCVVGRWWDWGVEGGREGQWKGRAVQRGVLRPGAHADRLSAGSVPLLAHGAFWQGFGPVLGA